MKLPNSETALVPKSKIENYLLSDTHFLGKSKSSFFKNYGFNENNVDIFIKSLLDIAANNEITDKVSTTYGTKYIIDGLLDTPVGKKAVVRTVWILENEDEKPRFITAYPK